MTANPKVPSIAQEILNQSIAKPVIELSEADVRQRIAKVSQTRSPSRIDRAESRIASLGIRQRNRVRATATSSVHKGRK